MGKNKTTIRLFYSGGYKKVKELHFHVLQYWMDAAHFFYFHGNTESLFWQAGECLTDTNIHSRADGRAQFHSKFEIYFHKF